MLPSCLLKKTKKLQNCGLYCPGWKSKKKYKYLDLAKELKRLWNMQVKIIQIVIDAYGTVTKRIIKGTGGLGSWRTNGGHQNYGIIENGHNSQKSPGYLRGLNVTQAQVKDHQLTLMRKTGKGVNNGFLLLGLIILCLKLAVTPDLSFYLRICRNEKKIPMFK